MNLHSPWKAQFPLASCFAMAVKNEFDISSSQWRLWLPVLSCSPSRGGGNVALSISGLESSTAHNSALVLQSLVWDSAESPQHNSQWRYLPSALAFCCLPQTQYQMLLWVHSGYCSDETVCFCCSSCCVRVCVCVCVNYLHYCEPNNLPWVLIPCVEGSLGWHWGASPSSKYKGCWDESKNGVSKHGCQLFYLSHPLVHSLVYVSVHGVSVLQGVHLEISQHI